MDERTRSTSSGHVPSSDQRGVAERRWRLFVAIPVPDHIRGEISRRVAAVRDRGTARWVAEQNLHLTLAFLGGRPPEDVPAIVAATESVARDASPYVAALGESGTFGGGRRGRVLWLALRRGRAETAVLAEELERVLVAADERALQEDRGPASHQRRPTPHLTLAREADKDVVTAARSVLASGPSMEWRVERVHLYRSHLGRGAPSYEELAAAPLAGRGSGLRSGPCSCRPRGPRGC